MMKSVSEDVSILEERLKENSVIEKVYLKELERKRIENHQLKKDLENAKAYLPHNTKVTTTTTHKPLPTPTHRETDKKEKYHHELGAVKQETHLQTKKYMKAGK